MSTRYPTKVAELPGGDFFAILTPKTTRIPGDERSRSAPGHGYPEHDEQSWILEVFPTFEAWKQEIDFCTKRGKVFSPVQICPARVQTTTTVEVSSRTPYPSSK
jgi:hypothetical protein